MAKVTMRQLLEAGVHFGHRTRYWNPKMAPYIFGHRSKVHIINLEKTLPMLDDALNFLSALAANGGKILFVGTKQAASEVLTEAAKRCEMPYVSRRWLGGMLTNFKTVRQSVERLKDIEVMEETGHLKNLNKKEVLELRREAEKLDNSLGGIRDMGYLPDAIFIIDVGYENIAVKEANKLGIPVVGIVDTNNRIDGINYIIPGNDDAIRAITLYVNTVADVIIDARQSVATDISPPKTAIASKTITHTTLKPVSPASIDKQDKQATIATQTNQQKPDKANTNKKPASLESEKVLKSPSDKQENLAHIKFIREQTPAYRGARGAWYKAIKAADGMLLEDFKTAVLSKPPSTPKTGKFAGVCEPPSGWIKFFESQGNIEIVYK